jgi:hypothetical protein
MKSKIKNRINKSCSNCRFVDTYFGDCCYPKGGSCKDLIPSIRNCLDKNLAWWKPIK